MTTKITGDLYIELDGKFIEIKRQMRQSGGYPFDAEKLNRFLQRAVEGKFNDGQHWREENGVIYLSVTSDGTTGPEWIKRLEKKGIQLSKWAKDVLNSSDFKPTNGVIYQIAVLKGELFKNEDRITKKIRAEAERRNLQKPNAEVACLIRENFSDEDIEAMGLMWLVVFHEPIKDSAGDSSLLAVDRDDGGCWLDACSDRPEYSWNSDDGFVFAVSQVSN